MTKGIDKASWVAEELRTVDLGDARLDRRLNRLVEKLGSKPNLSIPGACTSWVETKAAYRFFSHKKVTAEKILLPHIDATVERMKQEAVVLMPQDTTELDYTGKKDIAGLGYIGQHENRRGLYLHPTLAVTPEKVCLGVVHAKVWAREIFGVKKDRKNKKIEDKESIRWLESFRESQKLAQRLPDTLIVNIADREGDIYEFFLETNGAMEEKHQGAHWIIRASADRRTVSDDKLWSTVEKTVVLGTLEFDMPAGRGRKARKIKQEIRATEVELKSPKRVGEKLPCIKLYAVMAKEINVPAGEKPVEWLLLTSLPISNAETAHKIIEWYLCRWQIEIYFNVLKNGCEVEELQLESMDRLVPCLALYMIVAWRVLFTVTLGKNCPDMPCNCVFEDVEWKSVFVVIHKQKPPFNPPRLEDMVRMIASLGGFLNRKGDGFPGVQTVWIGIQRMRDFTISWEAFNEIG